MRERMKKKSVPLQSRPLEVDRVLRRPLPKLSLRISGASPAAAVRIGVVGARRATSEQLAVAQRLVGTLSDGGAVIVSGGAIGVDATAHEATLERRGITLAVLPSGLKAPSPSRHAGLYHRIAEGPGAVLSPFEDETKAALGHFHLRNRVICHMIDALIVICADARSGSLNCARQAWQLDLPVLAVPWTAGSPNSLGSNGILSCGGRAIHDEIGAISLLERLQTGRGQSLLLREPSLRTTKGAQRTERKPSTPQHRQVTIDEALSARQTCAAPRVQPPAELRAPQGCSQEIATAIGELLKASEEDGVNLEAAVQKTGHPRSEVATILFRLTLDGQLQRAAHGCYRRGKIREG